MLNNDRQITISSAGNHSSTKWPTQKIYISDFYDKLKTPVRGTETYTEYSKSPKSQQDSLKDVGGFVGGIVHDGGRRKSNTIDGRDLITLDLDHIPSGGADDILRRVDGLGCGYAIYSTRKHAPDSPRLRIILPLDRTVTADEYEPIARKAAQLIGIEFCDPSTFEASRLMYWPSCCSDSQYIYTYGDKPFLSANGVLAMYTNWHTVSEWPEVPGVQQAHIKLAQKQGNPTEKQGIVGAFCRTYDIYSAMDKFLLGVYEPCDIDGRYTFTGGSTAGGAVIYDNGNFLYSHHATDPAGGKLCNAFDLVRLHLFAEKDDDAKQDTPPNRLPSFTAMCEFAVSDDNVSAILNKERYEKATEIFADGVSDANDEPSNWMQKLQKNGEGSILKTIDNILIILENDPLIKNKIATDLFASRGAVLDDVPWDKRRTDKKRFWDDIDDSGIRHYLERVYQISGKDKIIDALTIHGNNCAFDEVCNYLDSVKWDGIKRLDTIFTDYLGVPDNVYTRAVARKTFAAAVARAKTPGIKFDCMTIVTGPQGLGKSTLFDKMSQGWFTDNFNSFDGKEFCELIQGIWIAEISEMHAFNKAEVGRVKQILSQRIDRFRAAYGRSVKDCPRRCIIVGTSNDYEFLKDNSGERRFWPIDGNKIPPTKSVFTDLDNDVDQIWAEAVMAWRLGEFLDLTGEAKRIWVFEVLAHKVNNTKEGVIQEFIARPIPIDWGKRTLMQRRMYWANDFEHSTVETTERKRICAAEIWCECFVKEISFMKQTDTREINGILSSIDDWERDKTAWRFGKDYGQQRGYIRTE